MKKTIALLCACLFLAVSLYAAPGGKLVAPGRFSHGIPEGLNGINDNINALTEALTKDPSDFQTIAALAGQYSLAAEITGDKKYQKYAASAYIRAAELSQLTGRLRFTREVSEFLASLSDREALDDFFQKVVLSNSDMRPGDRYLALVDYADALGKMKDSRAKAYFEEAIKTFPENSTEAYNRYGQYLLDSGLYEEALNLLNRLKPEERVATRMPAFLRREAMKRLNMDTSTADAEISRINGKYEDMATTSRPSDISQRPYPQSRSSAQKIQYSHNSSTDDCRAPGSPSACINDGLGRCWYFFAVNLAELMYNEARSERKGAQDLVGWTVRNRALQGVSCDAYVGGVVGFSSCRTNLPCSSGNPAVCDLSKWYCCVMHGATTRVGTLQEQFNDGHVSISNLVSSGLLDRMADVVDGRAPDISSGFIPSGISGCNTSCDVSHCTTGYNNFDPSPFGPMEYLPKDYCAKRREGSPQCKKYKANVCGQSSSPPADVCGTTTLGGDNFFWNRLF